MILVTSNSIMTLPTVPDVDLLPIFKTKAAKLEIKIAFARDKIAM